MWTPLWVQKGFDRYADQAARPVRGRHLIGVAGIGILAWRIDEMPWFAIIMCIMLLGLALALANRHETLESFRDKGIDPYNKEQVKADRAKIHRQLQSKGIIPPD